MYSCIKKFRIIKTSEYRELFYRAPRVIGEYFVLLYKNSKKCEPDCFRFGITVSKKVGNAVKRNRYKRIMKVLVREFCTMGCGKDINIIAKRSIVGKSFSTIKSDFVFCLNKIFTYEKNISKNS